MTGKKIIIVGAGSFACNVISYLEEDRKTKWEIIGLVDPNPAMRKKSVSGYKIIGNDDDLPRLFKKGVKYAILGIGATAGFDMSKKKRIFDGVKRIGFKAATLISDLSVVHKSAKIGEGVVIPPYVVIDPEVEIGDDVCLSPYVYLSHHVKLAGHIFISSFVNFVGGVTVGNETFIGMSATIGKDLGKNCNIYPNTLVMEPVEDNMVGFGNPMRKISKSIFNKTQFAI